MKIAVTTLVFIVAALLALGMVMLYSASMTMVNAKTNAAMGAHYLIMQLVWCALGLAACGTMAALDYALLKKIWWLLLAVAIVMLALVLVPNIGVVRGRARRWFVIGGFSLQPSEFAKLAVIIALAWYGERFQRQMPTFKRGILIPSVFIGIVLGLIFVEPDRGSTILLGAVAGAMLLIAGVRWKYFVPPIVLGVAGLAISIWHDPMRMKRIFSWLDLEQHRSGVGYQAYQAMLALGSGGWTGLGLGNGRQKMGFVPEHHTDFIFSIIGEELGLVATLLIVLGFLVLVVCGVYIAIHSRDTFGLLLGFGLTFLIGLQAFINIGVVTSALPNKGLPLPFISYGGSNLLAMLSSVGLLLSIARRGRVPQLTAESLADSRMRERSPQPT
jgi:cell division protein FtsW